jgi:hypothetical protein
MKGQCGLIKEVAYNGSTYAGKEVFGLNPMKAGFGMILYETTCLRLVHPL